MCSYVPKKTKLSFDLLSTMHSDTSVSDDVKQKPDMITYYNQNKTGVDTMGQMVQKDTSQ